MPPRLTALVIAHDARAPGGVNNFLRIMRLKMRRRVDARRFANGRRHGEKGKARTLRRLIRDYVRFVVLLRQRDFQVVHLNPTLDLSSLPRELLFVWLVRLFRPKSKVLLFYRGWDWNALDHIKANGLLLYLFRQTQLKVDRILLLSQQFKNALVEMGVPADRIFTTTTMFEGDALRKVLASPPRREPQTLLFMSRFLPAKGGDIVIEAFSRIRKRYPEARLIMAGDGPDMARLKGLADHHQVSEAITFTGYVGGATKMALLARASLFVFPTAHPEGMPNVLLEAMAAGDVVISTAVGGIPDIVIDGVNGAIIAAHDVEALTEAVERYLSHPGLLSAISDRNQAEAWNKWESAIVAERIADHYGELVGLDTHRTALT